jgi:hypothetical protein
MLLRHRPGSTERNVLRPRPWNQQHENHGREQPDRMLDEMPYRRSSGLQPAVKPPEKKRL